SLEHGFRRDAPIFSTLLLVFTADTYWGGARRTNSTTPLLQSLLPAAADAGLCFARPGTFWPARIQACPDTGVCLCGASLWWRWSPPAGVSWRIRPPSRSGGRP